MSNFSIQCPKCRNRVVWRFFYPKVRNQYCCQLCGNCWKEPIEETQSQYGTFYGNWEGQQMTKLEEAISVLKPDTDWSFFKGRKLWTAWQAFSPQWFITTHTLDELIYWVAKATTDANGTWYETYRRLADSSLAPMDVPHS
jgi:hypothetical protein